jgi:hypothetical protein
MTSHTRQPKPPVKRPLLTLASAFSLLLAAAVVALWVHSGFHYVYAWRITPSSAGWVHWETGSARGRLYFKRVEPVVATGRPDRGVGGGPGSGPANWQWMPGHSLPGEIAFAGFNFFHRPAAPGRPDYREIVIPDYFILILLLILPARWWATRGRTPPGLCRDCGYDLRATPDRCPECGTPAAT